MEWWCLTHFFFSARAFSYWGINWLTKWSAHASSSPGCILLSLLTSISLKTPSTYSSVTGNPILYWVKNLVKNNLSSFLSKKPLLSVSNSAKYLVTYSLKWSFTSLKSVKCFRTSSNSSAVNSEDFIIFKIYLINNIFF